MQSKNWAVLGKPGPVDDRRPFQNDRSCPRFPCLQGGYWQKMRKMQDIYLFSQIRQSTEKRKAARSVHFRHERLYLPTEEFYLSIPVHQSPITTKANRPLFAPGSGPVSKDTGLFYSNQNPYGRVDALKS
jgi:hypothetical protein